MTLSNFSISYTVSQCNTIFNYFWFFLHFSKPSFILSSTFLSLYISLLCWNSLAYILGLLLCFYILFLSDFIHYHVFKYHLSQTHEFNMSIPELTIFSQTHSSSLLPIWPMSSSQNQFLKLETCYPLLPSLTLQKQLLTILCQFCCRNVSQR